MCHITKEDAKEEDELYFATIAVLPKPGPANSTKQRLPPMSLRHSSIILNTHSRVPSTNFSACSFNSWSESMAPAGRRKRLKMSSDRVSWSLGRSAGRTERLVLDDDDA